VQADAEIDRIFAEKDCAGLIALKASHPESFAANLYRLVIAEGNSSPETTSEPNSPVTEQRQEKPGGFGEEADEGSSSDSVIVQFNGTAEDPVELVDDADDEYDAEIAFYTSSNQSTEFTDDSENEEVSVDLSESSSSAYSSSSVASAGLLIGTAENPIELTGTAESPIEITDDEDEGADAPEFASHPESSHVEIDSESSFVSFLLADDASDSSTSVHGARDVLFDELDDFVANALESDELFSRTCVL
jgi:hypothetical protein